MTRIGGEEDELHLLLRTGRRLSYEEIATMSSYGFSLFFFFFFFFAVYFFRNGFGFDL